MRRLDILALVTDGFGAAGGIARYNADLMSALARTGNHRLHVVPRFGSANAPMPGGVSQEQARGGQVQWALASMRAAVSRKLDVIFCGHINAVPLAAALAGARRLPLWVQVHGFEAWTSRSSAIRWGIEQAALVTSVSRYTRRRLLEWTRLDPACVRVLPNTFSLAFSSQARPDRLAAKLCLQDRKIVLTVGRIEASEKYKGHDRVIRLLPRVLAAEPLAHYVIAGSGSDVERLKGIATDVGVREHVSFAGQVPADELADYFALASVFAMPSTGEGFGIVFLEAAASGAHVIGGNRDGSLDALADGAIGDAVDPDDAEALLNAIVEGLRRPAGGPAAAVARFAFDKFAAHANDLAGLLAAEYACQSGLSRR